MQNSFTFDNYSDLNSMTNAGFGNYDTTSVQRRSSLGNIGLQSSQLNEFSQISPDFYQPLTPINSHPNLVQQQDNTSNPFFIQLQKQINDQDRLTAFTRQPGFRSETDQNRGIHIRALSSSKNHSILEPRRNSVCVSTLQSVQESRSLSPLSHQQNQRKNQALKKIEYTSKLEPPARNSSTRKLSFDSSQSTLKARMPIRGESLGGSTGSFDSCGSINRLDINEEKLAKTGNIFHRREDWSILSRLPINKQNTIHIRLEDEGPYGNDETRCFVLSHFSTLGIRHMECVFCSCKMVIYDRFPLVDGTLFISPFLYGEKKAVPAIVSNRNQFIYTVCLECMSGSNGIKCKFCDRSWLTGSSLQIGTLYKYDIFAAEPCCAVRVVCKKCGKPLVNLTETGGLPYFSMYSDLRECSSCKSNDYHFIKPLDEIYTKFEEAEDCDKEVDNFNKIAFNKELEKKKYKI